MMIREFDVEVLRRIDLSPRFFLGVVMGVLLFACLLYTSGNRWNIRNTGVFTREALVEQSLESTFTIALLIAIEIIPSHLVNHDAHYQFEMCIRDRNRTFHPYKRTKIPINGDNKEHLSI